MTGPLIDNITGGAQRFPDSCVIFTELDGKPLSRAAAARIAGNGVRSRLAGVLIRAAAGLSVAARERRAA